MRPDFMKILIERPRTQSSEPSRKWGKRIKYSPDMDYEDEPKRAKSSRRWQYGYDYRHSTDVLGPLKKYLESKVGQDWDDVYSEICQNMDKRSTVGAHIFTHLWQYVKKDCYIGAKTGKVYCEGGRSTPYYFYVHPWTNKLCKVPQERPFWRRRHPSYGWDNVPVEKGGVRYTGNNWNNGKDIPPFKSYFLIDGLWYYTEWTLVTLYREYTGFYRPRLEKYEDIVFLKKRQLSKKELRDLKLKNGRLAG